MALTKSLRGHVLGVKANHPKSERKKRAIQNIKKQAKQADVLLRPKQAMIEAGYSPATVPSSALIPALKAELKDVIAALEVHRAKVAFKINMDIDNATYPQLINALDVVNKNLLLLQGKPTSIIFGAHINLDKEEKERIDSLFESIE